MMKYNSIKRPLVRELLLLTPKVKRISGISYALKNDLNITLDDLFDTVDGEPSEKVKWRLEGIYMLLYTSQIDPFTDNELRITVSNFDDLTQGRFIEPMRDLLGNYLGEHVTDTFIRRLAPGVVPVTYPTHFNEADIDYLYSSYIIAHDCVGDTLTREAYITAVSLLYETVLKRYLKWFN